MTLEKIELLEKKYPSRFLKYKDCWMSAMAMVCIICGRDTDVLKSFAWFFYSRKIERISCLDDVITNQISINFDGDKESDEYQQSHRIEQNLNIKTKYYSKRKVQEDKKLLYDSVCFVFWFDAYDCRWNPMNSKKHIMHCATGCFVQGKCFIFDGLKSSKFFEIGEDEIFELAKYFFLFDDEELFITDKNVGALGGYSGCRDNVHRFAEDLKCLEPGIVNDKAFKSRESSKLFIRIFRNQCEKVSGLIDLANKDKWLMLLQEHWEKASILAAKVCFLEAGKRELCYKNLCDCLFEIVDVLGKENECL